MNGVITVFILHRFLIVKRKIYFFIAFLIGGVPRLARGCGLAVTPFLTGGGLEWQRYIVNRALYKYCVMITAAQFVFYRFYCIVTAAGDVFRHPFNDNKICGLFFIRYALNITYYVIVVQIQQRGVVVNNFLYNLLFHCLEFFDCGG